MPTVSRVVFRVRAFEARTENRRPLADPGKGNEAIGPLVEEPNNSRLTNSESIQMQCVQSMAPSIPDKPISPFPFPRSANNRRPSIRASKSLGIFMNSEIKPASKQFTRKTTPDTVG